MTTEQILDIIRKSEFKKDKNNKFGPSKSSNILCVFNNKVAYGVWIAKYPKEELISVCELFPNTGDSSIEELSNENLDNIKLMWSWDITSKFGSIQEAVKNYNN